VRRLDARYRGGRDLRALGELLDLGHELETECLVDTLRAWCPKTRRMIGPRSSRSATTRPFVRGNQPGFPPRRRGSGAINSFPSPLMARLPIIVRHELVGHVASAAFPEENRAIQTLPANRAHDSLCVSVGVPPLDGRQDEENARAFRNVSESLRSLAVLVADEGTMARQAPRDRVTGPSSRAVGADPSPGP